MGRSQRRVLLVLAYASASLLAQAAHYHGHAASESTRCRADCSRDTQTHVSGHSSPDLEHARDDCPACQLRTKAHLGPQFQAPALDRPIALAAEPTPVLPPRRVIRQHSSRAPPEILA